MVLADTYECTHCGHVFDEHKSRQLSQGTAPEDLKSASLEEECGNCGAMVRSGLVRCWNCNAFMREDIARRYQQLATTPQKIIYSDIPPEKRTDYLPPRVVAGSQSEKVVADADAGFTLKGAKSVDGFRPDADFTLDNSVLKVSSGINVPQVSVPQVNAPESKTCNVEDGPDKPKSTTPGGAVKEDSSHASARNNGDAAATADTADPSAANAQPGHVKNTAASSGDADDLLSIAMAEEKESDEKKGRGGRGTVTQILIPCPKCSNLVRASEQQAGKKVRCPKCKGPVAIPAIPAPKPRRKAKASSQPKVSVNVTWLSDAWLHVFSPTSVVLKPGSMAEPHSMVDIAVTEAGVFLVSYGKDAAKKGAADQNEGGVLSFVRTKLFGFLGKGASDVTKAADELRQNYKQVREQVSKTGEFKNLPNAEVRTIDSKQLALAKLVQPIVKAHESMFAGVPVFGEGRIALYLPIEGAEGEQSYLSLTISSFRMLSEKLKTQFSIEFTVEENGVPATEKMESHTCSLDQTKFDAIQDVVYYEQDSSFDLELVGHRCASCGATVSEEGRKKAKLGGIAGKGLAKAKCPKCGGKFGTDPLYKVIKSTEEAED